MAVLFWIRYAGIRIGLEGFDFRLRFLLEGESLLLS